MAAELIISGAGALVAVISVGITAWRAKTDRDKERLKEDAANVKAPAEAQALIFTAGIEGSEKAMMLFKQVAEAAQKDADRKAAENDKLLSRIALLEQEVEKRDDRIRQLQDKTRNLQDDIWKIQRELNTLTSGVGKEGENDGLGAV